MVRKRWTAVGLVFLLLGACGGEQLPNADSVIAAEQAPAPAAAADSTMGAPTAGETNTLPKSSPSAAGEYRLAGNEPFWSVRITAKGLTYTTPDYQKGILFPATAPEASGTTLRWVALTPPPEAHTLEVTLEDAKCQDSMADKTWTHRATVTFDGTRLSGCGERLTK